MITGLLRDWRRRGWSRARDEYIDEMLAMSLSQTEEIAPPELASPFDLFGVSVLEIAGEIQVAPTPEVVEDVVVAVDLFDGPFGLVEGASDLVDPPLPFDVLSGFVFRHDYVSDFSSMDLSTFEYLLVSHVIDLSAPSSPTSQIFDIDDEIAQHDSDDDSSPASDSDPVDQRFSPAVGDTEIVDFGTADQPRELRIGSDLSTDERDSLIQLLRSYLDARPVKQKLRRLHPRWSLQVKEEIQKQLSVGFLSVVEYPEWLANVVPVPKKDGKSHAIRIEERRSHISESSDHTLHDMMHRDVEVYVDDMIVKSRDRSDHLAALERFFERIRQFRLRLNPKKCTFGVTSGKLLDTWTEREVRGFLGRLQYISRFIARLTDICEPIFRLLRKSQPTVWDDQCQRAFERIREYLLSPPVLAPPTPGRPLLLYLSVSDVALGCMLAQLDDSGKDRAIYYLSKRMLDYETRYVMIERHCLALVWATRRLRHYMTEYSVQLISRLDPLRYLFDRPALVGRLMRWLRLLMMTFQTRDVAADLFVCHSRIDIPATKNIVEYEACILGLETALELGIRQMEVFGDSNLVLRQIQAQNQFADALATLASMIDIPVDATVRPLLIESRSAPAYCCLIDDAERMMVCHDHEDRILLVDHGDRLLPVRSEMSECQIHGDLIHVPPSELHALTSPWPFSVWGIDIIGKISPKSSSGHEFILVAIDYFTKWVEAASYARLTSAGVASFIRSHIICRYGVPHELISDRGVHFRAEVDTLVQRYSIRHHRSSAYRPQTNGAVEAANKNIKRILRRMVETSRDWSEKLPFALWAYRTSFSHLYRRHTLLLEQQILEADWAQARLDQLNLLDERRLRAADHVRAYQRKMARAFKKRVKPRPLRIGDLVLKVIRGLIRDPRGKFRPNWSGPYFIRELTPEGAAWLMDLDGNRFSEPTNVDQLKSYPSRGSILRIIITHITTSSFCFICLLIDIIFTLGIPSLVSFHFYHPITLAYVTSRVLRPPEAMGSDVVFSSLYLDSCVRITRIICTIIITYWMLTETRTWSLPYGAPEIHLASSALLDAWMPSCLSIWGEVTCSRIDDSMLPDLRPIIHSDAHTGAYFPFRTRFTDFHRGHVCDDGCFHDIVLRTCHAPDAILGHIPFRRIFMDLRRGHMFEDR
ncbi:Transposon Tf2-12 polyprotein [Vitis vinifera]|uniref:Transposon Tf2-12 polyprotein n=1 Tax=Vitis vinifera TaxID=29760 RepID=A0A438HMV0_VITVI|nr:Transposon Tf2-12 polyprotein [Vitis vinifera]